MENKNNAWVLGIVLFAAGILAGYFIFGGSGRQYAQFGGNMMGGSGRMPGNMHSMSDGSIMQNDSMNYTMNGMMMGLSGKTGEEFDRAFLSEMIMHHQGAIVMAQAVLQNSDRPELKQLADDIISAQTKEIEMMQGWQKEWFGQ